MAKLSKMVMDRQKSARSVQSAARTHRRQIVAQTSERFGQTGVGPAAGVLLDSSVERLEEATGQMVAADDAYLREQGDDPPARKALDEAAGGLRDGLLDVRGSSEANFGKAYAARLGFEGRTPDDPQAMLRLSHLVVDNLGTVPLPKPRLPGVTADPAQWQALLQQHHAPVQTAMEAVATEQREHDAAYVAKKQAMDTFDTVFSCTANLVSALLHIAGEDELADRVRPSGRKTGRTVADARDDEATGAGGAS
jgi:hypothetical protein